MKKILFILILGILASTFGIACDYSQVQSGQISRSQYVACMNEQEKNNPFSFLDAAGGIICTQTDGGNNPNVYGVTTVHGGILNGNFPDECCYVSYCSPDDLGEFFCDPSEPTGIGTMDIHCQYGCVNGACRPAPNQVTTTTLPIVVQTCESVGYMSSPLSGYAVVTQNDGTVVGKTCQIIYIQSGLNCYGNCKTVVTTTIAPTTTLPVQKTCAELGMLSDQPVGQLCSGNFYIAARQLCWNNCKAVPTTTTTMTNPSTTQAICLSMERCGGETTTTTLAKNTEKTNSSNLAAAGILALVFITIVVIAKH